jgi:hypothetical protein
MVEYFVFYFIIYSEGSIIKVFRNVEMVSLFWTIFILILLSLVKVLPTVLPLGTVEWIMRKFEIHSKLSINYPININGRELNGNEKQLFVDCFNEAIFMEKYYIYPGTEYLYVPPEKDGTPVTVDTKIGKFDVKLYLYNEGNSIDVVKQTKKKIVSYNLSSDKLQSLYF